MTFRAAISVLICALFLGACGGDDEPSQAIDYDKALAGAPPELADLYARGNELIPGGRDAFADELAKLRGYPVVANFWASWCLPCREEFPEFQAAAAEHGKRIAFIGVNTEDFDDAARTFLEDYPLPYPSVTDPDKEVQKDLGLVGLPGTAFYDEAGELLYLKQGPYTDEAQLQADIAKYAEPS
jgi:thiol-disulfide isomerase/thioredoxin